MNPALYRNEEKKSSKKQKDWYEKLIILIF